METEFHYLTKTAIELHNDVKFIRKRIKEQDAYLEELQFKYKLSKMTTARFSSLAFSAGLVRDELCERLDAIQQGTIMPRESVSTYIRRGDNIYALHGPISQKKIVS
jgi:hypothetical protein